ncbi:MAG: DUF4382 domain-containing protein [Chitinophagaceae bacterium]
MRNTKMLVTMLPIAFCLMLFSACTKNNQKTSQLSIRMTDAPFDAQEVNVEIKEVRVNFASDTLSWVSLPTNAKVYNLLGLQNGVDTLLATGSIPTGTVQQLRLVLGINNSIKINNITYPLSVASADESGLKIKVSKELKASLEKILIDFDANLSIIQTGNGTYKLKPVIKLK